jgi:protein involved in polysaccharide export with SLBB domain
VLALVLLVAVLAPSLTPAQAQAPATAPAPSAPGPAAPAVPQASTTPAARPDTLLAPGTGQRIVVGPDYRLGPGDLIEIQIAGRVEVQRQSLVVDIEGNVNLPPLGTIGVGGLTVHEATRRVAERARTYFRFADVTVSVQQPRAFEVVVTGEVQRPGSALVSASRRLQDVVLGAGGLTPRGSMRRIKATRGGVEREYDLLRFELGGDVTQNPLVEEGMRIHVPAKQATVTLAGGVRRPGEYELGPGGSLAELLALVGGVTETAAPRQARLTRGTASGARETSTVDLTARPADVALQPGDTLQVPTVASLQDVIEVRGALQGTVESTKGVVSGKPVISQRLELAKGDRVRDVVARLGGVTPLGDLRLAFIDRSGSAGPSQRIPVDLHRLFVDKDESQNVLLENGDALNVPVLEDKIFLNGEVKATTPQDFRPEWTARDYIASVGGFTTRAKPEKAFVTFRDGKSYPIAQAPALEAGATIVVPEVAVKWYQDYLSIGNTVATMITSWAAVFFLFGGGN